MLALVSDTHGIDVKHLQAQMNIVVFFSLIYCADCIGCSCSANRLCVLFGVCVCTCVRYPVDLVNDLNCGAGSADEPRLGTALCRLRGGWQAR